MTSTPSFGCFKIQVRLEEIEELEETDDGSETS